MRNAAFFYFLLFTMALPCAAQSVVDSAKVDTTTQVEVLSETDSLNLAHSPKRAAWMSTALPGLGQIYNKKYWKAPIIWGGMGAAVYLFAVNQQQFQLYKEAYLARVTEDNQYVDRTENPFLSDAAILQESETFRSRMEWSVIGFAGLYLLNIVDAAVDAHFFYFDVSDDLSFHWQPTVIQHQRQFQRPSGGLSLCLTF